ncbi:MAG TPA: ribosome maturation factor RimP [Dermatophilaceae bacterium]|nr:ribosome maturation factor RimP [Dermatophilaceae bacterium]
MSTADRIAPLLATALEGSGVALEDVSVTPAGRRRVVRVVVDRPVVDAGDATEPVEPLSLDEVADATRVVDAALEGSDAMGEQPYTLEVSSPGVGRPLTAPRHFRRNVGRLLELHPQDGEPVTGRLLRAGTEDLTVEVTGSTGVRRRLDLAYAALARAEVQVEFSRPARAGTDDTGQGG